MAQIKCPHCGFMNFAISSYCGRCERPLKEDTQPTVTPPEAQPKPRGRPSPIERIQRNLPVGDGPTAVSPRPTLSRLEDDEATVVRSPQNSLLQQNQARQKPAPTRPEPAPSAPAQAPRDSLVRPEPMWADSPRSPPPAKRKPPPTPPEATQVKAAPPRSAAELDPEILKRLDISAAHARLDLRGINPLADETIVHPSPREAMLSEPTVIYRRPAPQASAPSLDTNPTIIPATAPALWRLFLAQACDASVVAAAAGLSASTEMLLFAGHWPSSRTGFLDTLAAWLAIYPNTALRAVLLAGVWAFLYNTWGSWRGRTLGQQLSGLSSLRLDGTPIHPLLGAWRSIAALVSVCAFGAGYFWVIVDPRRRTWHDVVSNCVIVRRQLH